MDSLGEATLFTTLGTNWGSWQVSFRNENRDKPAFVCHCGSYRFKLTPFGPQNSSATFQRAIGILMSRLKRCTCLVYPDDIIIFYGNLDEHLDHISALVTVLRNVGITLKLRKCEFFTNTVQDLGHIIRSGRLKIEKDRMTSLAESQEPGTQTDLRSLSGLINLY